MAFSVFFSCSSWFFSDYFSIRKRNDLTIDKVLATDFQVGQGTHHRTLTAISNTEHLRSLSETLTFSGTGVCWRQSWWTQRHGQRAEEQIFAEQCWRDASCQVLKLLGGVFIQRIKVFSSYF